MPITVEWDPGSAHLLLVTTRGKYSWEEYHAALDQVFAIVDSGTPVQGVITVRQSDTVAPGGNPLPHVQRVMRLMSEHKNLIVVNVNGNMLKRVLVNSFMRITPDVNKNYLEAGSVEEARKIIARAQVASKQGGRP